MRFRFKVVIGSLVGCVVTLLIIHWELDNANIQWKWSRHFVPQVIVDKEAQMNIEMSTVQANKHDQKKPSINLQQTVNKLDQSEAPLNLQRTANDGHKTGYFQKLFQDTYIYSAFLEQSDQNKPVIRLIVLSGKHYQPKIFCNYCNDKLASCQCPSQLAVYYTNVENHGRDHGGFIASCLVPECFDGTSRFIDLTVQSEDTMSEVRVPLVSTVETGTAQHEYSVCIPPLRGEGTAFLYRVIEFIELTLTLGATHFTFYDYDIDDPLKKLLSYYEEKGVVTVLPWNLPSLMTSNINQLWYYGQVLAIQDCLYRNKAGSKFVAFNDIDEFIVPLKHPTVPLLLQHLHTEEFSGHCFDCVIFSLNARIPGAHKRSKLNSLRIHHRTSEKLQSWSKCIVEPRKIFEMGIHHISKATSPQLDTNKVDDTVGLLFHYRKCSSAYGIRNICGDLIIDDTVQRFTDKLQSNVDNVLEHLKLKTTQKQNAIKAK